MQREGKQSVTRSLTKAKMRDVRMFMGAVGSLIYVST